LPPTLSLLRQKLSQKAKQEPKFRFYALYDRIYRWDTLVAAWNLAASNEGAPGIDGITFEQVVQEDMGLVKFLKELQEDLRTKRYRPQPVKRVYIPKANGKLRPLGIPTIRDRVVQTAALLILEPIFEADFLDCSYGFRPGRSAHQALTVIRDNLAAGYREVYDADLEGYFDTIPHDKLMACLRMRITDRSVLQLLRMWLEAPVVDPLNDEESKIGRPGQGTPQGGVSTPPTILRRLVSWTVSYLVRGSDRATGRNGRLAGCGAAFCNAFFKEVSRHGRSGAAVGAVGGAFVCPLAFG
jgi:RNA-directed DNA polymerase